MQHSAAMDRPATPFAGISLGKFATWLFLASEVMFFTGLISSYIVLRAGSAGWPVPSDELNIPLTAFNTFVLICSSVTMVRAVYATQRGDQKELKRNLLATILLGTFFLGVQAYEWTKLLGEGLTPQRDLFGATFFTLTGFHGLHVLAGVITLVIVYSKALGGRYGAANDGPVEFTGLYWHFVDLVWILLFTIVYLI